MVHLLRAEERSTPHRRDWRGTAAATTRNLTPHTHVQSHSDDEGRTWQWDAVVLAEPFHLSFPHVHWDAAAGLWLMMPETSKALSLRLYSTTAELFPKGWKLAKTALTGRWAPLSPPPSLESIGAGTSTRPQYGTPASGSS